MASRRVVSSRFRPDLVQGRSGLRRGRPRRSGSCGGQTRRAPPRRRHSHRRTRRDRLRRDLHMCRRRRALLGEETSKAKNRSGLPGDERPEPRSGLHANVGRPAADPVGPPEAPSGVARCHDPDAVLRQDSMFFGAGTSRYSTEANTAKPRFRSLRGPEPDQENSLHLRLIPSLLKWAMF